MQSQAPESVVDYELHRFCAITFVTVFRGKRDCEEGVAVQRKMPAEGYVPDKYAG